MHTRRQLLKRAAYVTAWSFSSPKPASPWMCFYFYINKYTCTNCPHLIPEDSGLLWAVVAIMLVENRASILSLNLGSISCPVCLLLSWGFLPSVWLMFRACALPDLFLCCLCKFHLTTYFFLKVVRRLVKFLVTSGLISFLPCFSAWVAVLHYILIHSQH